MQKLMFIVLVTLSNQLVASGYTGYRDISLIHQRECSTDKGFEITFSDSHKNPDGCANANTVDLTCDHQAYETIVSIVLAAKLSERKVDFWVAGCGGDGNAKVVTARIQ